MTAPDARAVVAFGDPITDGTASTMNGNDRWLDVLARRLHAVYGNKIAVVNAGIGDNQLVGLAEYSSQKLFPGWPSAKDRLDRDVLSLSGITAVIGAVRRLLAAHQGIDPSTAEPAPMLNSVQNATFQLSSL